MGLIGFIGFAGSEFRVWGFGSEARRVFEVEVNAQQAGKLLLHLPLVHSNLKTSRLNLNFMAYKIWGPWFGDAALAT